MLNKKVLLGLLVAGAMLVPMTASAGLMIGVCVDCHTMHNSQDDGHMSFDATNLNPKGTLLRTGDGTCIGCHAVSGMENVTTTGAGSNGVPQVDSSTNPNLGGFFTFGGDANNQHKIAGQTYSIPSPLTTSPGGSNATADCITCHQAWNGGHHGDGIGDYRMLGNGVYTFTDAVSDSTYGSNDGPVPDTSATTYDADAMNYVCDRCHGQFHGSANQRDTSGPVDVWIRHPTDIALDDTNVTPLASYNYVTNYTNAGDQDIVPLGTGSSAVNGFNNGGAKMTIMCITCHYAHGSNQPDMLRFVYSDNEAGDDTPGEGCESCHNYTRTSTSAAIGM